MPKVCIRVIQTNLGTSRVPWPVGKSPDHEAEMSSVNGGVGTVAVIVAKTRALTARLIVHHSKVMQAPPGVMPDRFHNGAYSQCWPSFIFLQIKTSVHTCSIQNFTFHLEWEVYDSEHRSGHCRQV